MTVCLFIAPFYAQNAPFLTDLETISVGNVSRIHELAAIKGDAPVQKLAWSSDGHRLAVLRGDYVLTNEPTNNTVEIWSFENNTLPTQPDVILTLDVVDEMHWLPDSRSIVTHGEQDIGDKAHFLVTQWDAQTGESLKTLMNVTVIRPLFFEYEEDKYYAQARPPIVAWNNSYTQSASMLGNLGLRFSDGHIYRADYPDLGSIHSVNWTPDDQFVVVDFGSEDTYHIEILEAETLKSVLHAYGEDYSIQEIAWSSDHVSFAVASSWSSPFDPYENVRFYRLGEDVGYGGAAILVSAPIPEGSPGGQPHYIPSLAWNPDGALIAIKFPLALEFYNTTSYEKVAVLSEPSINDEAWNPAGKYLVTGDMNGALRLWGIQSTQ